jgi:recombination protein RecT
MEKDLEVVNKEVSIKDALTTPDVTEAYMTNADEKALVREVGFAVQILQGNDYLRKCTPASIRKSVKNVALTGITLNPAQGLAYLVPRNINKVQTCCLDFSYKGLCHVAVQSGAVYDIAAYVVYSEDEFHVEQGTNAEIRHTPSLEQDRGKATHVYAVATLHHNVKKFEVMTMKEVEEIRKISKQPNGLMWKDFYGEGCRKTVIKRLCKYLPQKGALAEAIALNNEVDGVEIEVGYISEDQIDELKDKISDVGASEEAFLNYMKVESLDKIWARDFKKAVSALNSMKKRVS